ncbi:MAG: DNA repair protein RadA, partial [candidate division NC10 bacterium]|nr:DNA repair protein RadA [candidate division NC10 bacterium]
FFGEVGLGGEVRRVAQTEKRLQELTRLGFTRAITAQSAAEGVAAGGTIATVGLSHVGELAEMFVSSGKMRFD